MTTQRKIPALWILSLPVITYGMIFGFAVVTLPQMLAADAVPGGHIAVAVAIVTSPAFWVFLVGPVLDVRFRRRTYALVFGILAACAAGFTVFDHSNLAVVEVVMVAGILFLGLYNFAIGGWTGALIQKDQDSKLGAWNTVFNFGGGGAGILLNGYLTQYLAPVHAAICVFAVFAIPMVVFPLIPAPPPDDTLASESFARFAREIASLFKRREVLIALPLFTFPSASFALTNALAGWANAFHASPAFVSTVTGIGSVLCGIVGCAIVPPLARKIPLRPLYLAIGVVGAAFTLSLLLLPRTPWTFGLAFYGETGLQAAAVATAIAIIYEIIGPDNPLASTIFGLLFSAVSFPIDYMEFIDGHSYDWAGVTGAFLSDSLLSIAACIFLAIVLRKWLFASPQKVMKSA